MNKFKILVISLVTIATFGLFSCGTSTSNLAEQVQDLMIKKFQQEGITLKVKEDLQLVHKSGNEYTGIMTVIVDGEESQLSVDVISDGKAFQYEIVDIN